MGTAKDVTLAAYLMSKDSSRLVRSAQVAEAAGYSRIWLNDGHVLLEDVYVHMTRVLDNTERVSVGTGVANPVTRHWTATVAAHGTLARIHPGRVVLGFGRGDAAVHMLGLPPMKTAEFAELAPEMKRLMRGDTIHAGDTEIELRWLDRHDVPLMLAATGPRNLRIAGAVADIVQIQVGVSPEAVGWALERIREGAGEAGRDFDEIDVSVLCAMWVSDDLEEARSHCRWSAATAANHFAGVMKMRDHKLPEALVAIVEERQRQQHTYDYESHLENEGEEVDFLTDEMVDEFTICGPADVCLEKIAGLRELGVSEIAPGFYNEEHDQLRRVGEEIVPAMNGGAEVRRNA